MVAAVVAMTMDISVTVKRKQDAEAIQRALADPETYALVVIMGTLLPLSEGRRAAVVQFAWNTLTDDE